MDEEFFEDKFYTNDVKYTNIDVTQQLLKNDFPKNSNMQWNGLNGIRIELQRNQRVRKGTKMCLEFIASQELLLLMEGDRNNVPNKISLILYCW